MISSDSTPVSYLRDPDVLLMLRVQGGDHAAFVQLVDAYQSRLLGLMTHMVSDRTAAEDLVQETFLRVYRARDRYEPRARFSTWLFHIAGNLARNRLRKLKRRREQSLDQAEAGVTGDLRPGATLLERSSLMPVRQVSQQETKVRVQEALDSLSERQRLAVLLSKFEGMSYSDIGLTMGLTEPAVKSLMFRARENLRIALQGLIQGEEGP